MEKHEADELVRNENLEKNETEYSTRDFDLGQVVNVESTPDEERTVRRKLDLLLIPLMGGAYFLQFLDKFILGQAALFNLREDLNLHGSEYSWTSSIFYFGYLIWLWPSSYVIVRLPIAKYLSVTVFLWGGIVMCHAACKGFSGLMAVRFFLGVGEAAVAPGFSLITGMFYRREEQPIRQSAWFFGNCLAATLGGLVSYGIGHINSAGVSSWQLIFLILGAITSGYAFLLLPFLPDSPDKTIFLTPKERTIAVKRTLVNKTGVMDSGSFKWNQALDAFTDPQTWLLALNAFTSNLANGGLTTFAAIITAGMGFSDFKALLLQMSLGGIQIVFLPLTSVAATFLPSARIFCMLFNTIVSLIGMILVWKLDPSNDAGRMVGLVLSIAFAVNLPISLSLITSNVAGFSKKSVVSATLFVAYCVGNIAGPQFFLASEEPKYPTGLQASMSGFCLSAFFLICLYCYYRWQNGRRNRRYGRPEDMTVGEELQDELSNKTDREIASFRYVL
ncbi:Allantoate [Aspergillus sp. HF37]|nr:Allantoate [Aspergillus sp. HF37]